MENYSSSKVSSLISDWYRSVIALRQCQIIIRVGIEKFAEQFLKQMLVVSLAYNDSLFKFATQIQSAPLPRGNQLSNRPLFVRGHRWSVYSIARVFSS